MTDYGDTSNYTGVICVAISGTPSAPAAGDKCYFYCESWTNTRDFKMKPTHLLDGSTIVTIKGKRYRRTQIEDWIILDDDGNATTNTQSLNNKTDMLDGLQNIDDSPCYMLLVCNNDSVNVHLSAGLDYMKGYLMNLRFRPEGGHYLASFDFLEATI